MAPKAPKRPARKNRNYRQEYDRYQSKPAQIKKRTSRNAARRALIRAGKVQKGDGKDVIHKNGNPKDNRPKNLGVQTASKNRSYPRNRNARKRNPYA
jgi:hypothetical protein